MGKKGSGKIVEGEIGFVFAEGRECSNEGGIGFGELF